MGGESAASYDLKSVADSNIDEQFRLLYICFCELLSNPGGRKGGTLYTTLLPMSPGSNDGDSDGGRAVEHNHGDRTRAPKSCMALGLNTRGRADRTDEDLVVVVVTS